MKGKASSLKVLHVLDHSLPLHSGYAFRSSSIFRAQRKRGWQPVAVTSSKHDENWKGERTDCETIEGVRYYRTGPAGMGGAPFLTELRQMFRLARRLQEVVDVERPDLLHAHSPILNAFPALWVGWKRGLPVVYEIRAFWEDAAVDHGTYGQDSMKYNLVKSLETWVCRRVDQVAVLCNGLKGDLIGRYIPSDKITVVFNGISEEEFAPSRPAADYHAAWKLDGKKVIGFVGSFYRYEGLDLLVEAFARLARIRPDVGLVLVGGGEMEGELRAQVQRLGLGEKVLLPGRIPHDRIPGVYGLMDVLAYPRYSMRLTELVTPLKPLEAMAMGKALVASDIGGHRELIQHGKTGLLFPAGDVSALVSALETLLDHEDLRSRLAQEESRWVFQEHTWERTTAVYEDIYTKALAHA